MPIVVIKNKSQSVNQITQSTYPWYYAVPALTRTVVCGQKKAFLRLWPRIDSDGHAGLIRRVRIMSFA